jgi:hypothetical protein
MSFALRAGEVGGIAAECTSRDPRMASLIHKM